MHSYSTNSPIPPKHIAYLMLAAVIVSGVVGTVVQYANTQFGWTLGGISAMALFSGLYFLFDRVIWKYRWVQRILLVPDLNGTWHCQGKTLYKGGAPKEYLWTATINIRQSWSRITIVQGTAQSGSQSIAASIYQEPGNGYRLIYHYDNKPKLGERELGRHCGLCNLLFTEAGDSAVGEYFTDKDRMTSGTMTLTRGGLTDEATRTA
jgi:hypothetical protein